MDHFGLTRRVGHTSKHVSKNLLKMYDVRCKMRESILKLSSNGLFPAPIKIKIKMYM